MLVFPRIESWIQELECQISLASIAAAGINKTSVGEIFVAVFNANASSAAVRMQTQSMEQFRLGPPHYFKGPIAPGHRGATQLAGDRRPFPPSPIPPAPLRAADRLLAA